MDPAFNKKPEPRKTVKARQDREDTARRRICTDKVWHRSNARCECPGCPHCGDGCRRYCKRASAYFKEVGHVDEILPKSQGGSPFDPTNCRLLCHDCHFSAPSGGHRKTVRP